jgi:hypothetical protein
MTGYLSASSTFRQTAWLPSAFFAELMTFPSLHYWPTAICCAVLLSQLLHSYVARGMGWPFGWDENLWSAKCPRSLLEQRGVSVKSNLVKDEDLGGDEPNCETNHQRAER